MFVVLSARENFSISPTGLAEDFHTILFADPREKGGGLFSKEQSVAVKQISHPGGGAPGHLGENGSTSSDNSQFFLKKLPVPPMCSRTFGTRCYDDFLQEKALGNHPKRHSCAMEIKDASNRRNNRTSTLIDSWIMGRTPRKQKPASLPN